MIIQLIVIFLGCFCTTSFGQFTGCDYYQPMVVGQTYDIYSPGYTANYPRNTNCRWTAEAPAGYTINLNCPDITIPSSSSCVNDRLEVSYDGRSDLLNAQKYCGTGTLINTSVGNKLVLALRVPATTVGGRFRCTIVTKAGTTTPPPATCDCGRRKTNRIVGGQVTSVNEYTMMAGLIDSTQSGIKCGAVIISALHGLTAAHCVYGSTATNLGLLVGDHDYTTGSDTAYSALYKIGSYVYHNGYSSPKSGQYINDIAIVKTTTTITFNVAVGPVCLPYKFSQTSFVGVSLIALGWGSTGYSEPVSPQLRKVDLNVISNSQCSSTYPAIATSQICTYTSKKDTCQYDSGGPLLYTDNYGVVYDIGLTSFGIGCATAYPGVSTSVPSFLSWIDANTPGVTLCRK